MVYGRGISSITPVSPKDASPGCGRFFAVMRRGREGWRIADFHEVGVACKSAGLQPQPVADPGMTIGRLAKAAGVGVETIRYYERLGLLERPSPGATGYRRYTQGHLVKLHYIRNAKALRLRLSDIAELRQKLGYGRGFCVELRSLVTARLQEVEATICELTTVRGQLQVFLRTCEQRPAELPCPVVADLTA